MEQLSSSATIVEARVKQDGKVVTIRGLGIAMKFSIVLVEQLFGKDKVDEVYGPLVSVDLLYVNLIVLTNRLLGYSHENKRISRQVLPT